MNLKSKKAYFCHKFEDNMGNKAKIWQTINSLLHSSKNSAHKCDKLLIDDKIIDDQKLIANKLNEHFCTICKVLSDIIDNNDILNSNTISSDSLNQKV